MSKLLQFKQLTLGFSLRRATCEFGDFRIWHDEETWWWALNDGNNSSGHSDGSEETLDEAMIACQKYYENLLLKKDS